MNNVPYYDARSGRVGVLGSRSSLSTAGQTVAHSVGRKSTSAADVLRAQSVGTYAAFPAFSQIVVTGTDLAGPTVVAEPLIATQIRLARPLVGPVCPLQIMAYPLVVLAGLLPTAGMGSLLAAYTICALCGGVSAFACTFLG